MSAKHFLHDPTVLVSAALRAATRTNPSLALDAPNKVLYRRTDDDGRETVALVSGGGSGHEPSFTGLVGRGLLTAAVAGTIFASPGAEQVRRCLARVGKRGKGVCVVVMNYTGDVLNFGMAVEKAKAAGVPVDMVVVEDDAGVGRAKGGKVGRRGIAGTVLVVKIAGALAETSATVNEVHDLATLTAANVVSVGASLSHVHVPGRAVTADDDTDALRHNETELGMGIHNEPGSTRLRGADLPRLIATMLAQLLDPADTDRAFLAITPEDETVLLVNNLGGVSTLEMGGVAEEVLRQLAESWEVRPVRVLVGTFMTSLNGMGFSVSLLRLRDTGLGEGRGMLELLDRNAEATGWVAPVRPETWARWREKADKGGELEEGVGTGAPPSGLTVDPTRAKHALTAGLNRLIAAEPDITHFDTVAGDGDCGVGLKRGAEGILELLNTDQPTDAALLLDSIVASVETTMDGTSGALYAIFLNALAHGLRTQSASGPATSRHWAAALDTAMASLGRYTPARPGDRTLVDALAPFIEELGRSEGVAAAAKAAKDGAERTSGMEASLGRTVYVGGEEWREVPDPGAHGLAEFLMGMAEGMS